MSRNDRRRVAYKARRDAHKCVSCGASLPEGDTRCMCEECRQRNREFYREYRELLTKLHRCPHCGKPVDDKDYKLCSACRKKDREEKRNKHDGQK